MTYHIDGAGLLGSMLMARFAGQGIDFTWSDAESEFTAWNASTGLVYPDADMTTFEYNSICWDVCREARSVPYVYAHKAPPHSAPVKASADYGLLRRSGVDAVVVDVGRFVEGARARHEAQRTHGPAAGEVVIVAHPCPQNTASYKWGWSAPVSFALPECLPADLAQPALYAKAHRFDMTYAYPYLNGVWLAGSSSIVQSKPHHRDDAEMRFEQWAGNARRLLGVHDIALEGPITEGWRPIGEKRVTYDGVRTWYMPSLGGNGVRQGWSAIDRALEAITSDLL